MASPSQPQTTNQNYAIDGSYLDQEFNRYVQTAQGLMQKTKSSEDRRICARYITICSRMRSDNIQIKHHRNRFFRFLLKIMKRTVDNQSMQQNFFFNLVSLYVRKWLNCEFITGSYHCNFPARRDAKSKREERDAAMEQRWSDVCVGKNNSGLRDARLHGGD
jgi:hypothetical protein